MRKRSFPSPLLILISLASLSLSCQGKEDPPPTRRKGGGFRWPEIQGPEDSLVSRGYATDKETLKLLAKGIGIKAGIQHRSWEFDIRLDAISLLANHKTEEVVNLLARIFYEDESEMVRDAAMFSLAKLGDSRAIPSISQAFRVGDPERKVRLALDFAKTGLPEATPMLLEALDIARTERLAVLINVLRLRGVRAGFDRIESVLHSSDREKWGEAMRALSEYTYEMEASSAEAEQVRSFVGSVLDGRDGELKEFVLLQLPKICGTAISFEECLEKLKDPDSVSRDPRIQELVPQIWTQIKRNRRLQTVKDSLQEIRDQQIREESLEGDAP